MKFIIESSIVPIYDRIAAAFAKTFMQFGHVVHFINTSGFNEIDFVRIINDIDFDYYITTNELNFIQKKSEIDDEFLFEKIFTKIVFVHHDNLFSSFNDINFILNKIKALMNIKKRSCHFCLESSNVDLLKATGISNAFKINHASEFVVPHTPTTMEQLGITFVGHLMSNLNLYPAESVPGGHHLRVLAWNRFSQSSYKIQNEIEKLAKDYYFSSSLGPEASKNLSATTQFLIAGLNKFSSPMRGQLISMIKTHQVDIFGGDLSYGRIQDPLMILRQSNVHYHPATLNYQDTANIYKASRISLNISSLQFDTAVNNRVFDVVNSGGFVLTDKRSDLFDICAYANEISFETPEEMNEKISFHTDIANNKRHLDIKEAIYEEFKLKFTYKNAVTHILKNIKPFQSIEQ